MQQDREPVGIPDHTGFHSLRVRGAARRDDLDAALAQRAQRRREVVHRESEV